ncbi:MAG: hypothetical protein VW714_12275, partial [Rhodospirillales bacterium]
MGYDADGMIYKIFDTEEQKINNLNDLLNSKDPISNIQNQVHNKNTLAKFSYEEVQLLPPLVPTTILCSGSNYRDHNDEKAASPLSGKEPEFFVKTGDCVVGPNDSIFYDERLSTKLDCET